MSIKYDKIIKRLEEMGMTNYYKVKRMNVIGQATYRKLKEGGDIDTRTIAKLCKLFDCQPGDLLDYVPDDEEDATGASKEESEE